MGCSSGAPHPHLLGWAGDAMMKKPRPLPTWGRGREGLQGPQVPPAHMAPTLAPADRLPRLLSFPRVRHLRRPYPSLLRRTRSAT